MSELVLFGGMFVLALLGQYVLALTYVMVCFAGGLTDGSAIVAFLLLFVAALFNRFRRAAG
jgi:hypothetical protein